MIICSNHEKQIPMIHTFAFIGAECWCPCCGNTTGIPFGDYETVDNSEELEVKYEKFNKLTEDYLYAMGVPHCSSTLWEGKWVPPNELPEEEHERLKKIRDEFKLLPEE